VGVAGVAVLQVLVLWQGLPGWLRRGCCLRCCQWWWLLSRTKLQLLVSAALFVCPQQQQPLQQTWVVLLVLLVLASLTVPSLQQAAGQQLVLKVQPELAQQGQQVVQRQLAEA